LEKSNLQAASLNEMSRVFHFQRDIPRALECVERGLEIFVRDGERIVHLYHLLLNRVIYLNRLDKVELAYEAVKELDHEIEVLKQNNQLLDIPVDIVIQMYMMYGIVLRQLNQPQKALEYSRQGMRIALRNKNYDRILGLRITCGSVYFSIGDFDEAQKYYLKALKLKNKITPTKKYLLVPVYENLGLVSIEQNNWLLAKEMLEKAMEISDEEGQITRKINLLIVLGKNFLGQQLYEEAVCSYQQAENLSRQHDQDSKLHEIIASLCSCFSKMNDLENLHYYKEKLYDISIKLWGV
jgi:tetratricopeptide (TPR) repeat protein